MRFKNATGAKILLCACVKSFPSLFFLFFYSFFILVACKAFCFH